MTEQPRRSWLERAESWLSRMSTKNNFWHRLCSMVWLPYAFTSGISMRRIDKDRFTAVLPFSRVNRNWYNAMAGAALLGNSEVAGGMYLFGECGGDYVVVCKEMKYRFLRPCLGPAVYRVVNSDDVRALIKAGGEFNVNLVTEGRPVRHHLPLHPEVHDQGQGQPPEGLGVGPRRARCRRVRLNPGG
jgi:hypothetical protein